MTVYFQRLESLAIFIASLYFYNNLGYAWVIFLLSWILPDVAAIGYSVNNKIGAISYNALHNYAGPSLLLIIGYSASSTLLLAASLIWFSHVSLDRFLGYGLKTEKGFKHTHLGLLGGKK